MPDASLAELKYLIERQREEIKTINEVGRLLSSTIDPQQTIRLVASYLTQTFPVALCGVLLFEGRKLQLIRFARIAQIDLVAAVRTICERAADLLKRPVDDASVQQVVEDGDAAAGQWTPSTIGSLRSQYLAPLTLGGKPIGLLCVFSGKANALTKEDEHVIDIVAEQLRTALRNAFLLDELTRANALKNELLMVISHELSIPLTSIKEGISLILEGALGAINPDQQDFLQTVNDSTHRLETLVGKVVTATQLVTAQAQASVQDTDLAAVLKELETQFVPMAQTKGVNLEVTGVSKPLRAAADAKRLKQAAAQLIENAIQATPADGKVVLAGVDMPGAVEIQIVDTGVGIPAEEMGRLFEQFLDHLVQYRSFLVARAHADKSHDATSID